MPESTLSPMNGTESDRTASPVDQSQNATTNVASGGPCQASGPACGASAGAPSQADLWARLGLAGQRVLVLGLGASGLAMARWCTRAGALVTVADTRQTPPQAAALAADCPQAQFVGGPFDAAALAALRPRVLALSPGLAPALTAPIIEALGADSASEKPQILGELGLYAQALAALREGLGYAPAVLAITGTNGKTTVTSLTGQLVARAGRSVAVAGNIGPTLLDTLSAHLQADTLPQVWVLELSSFQLDGVVGFEPTAATVLNLTQDHLDWHGSMAAYGAAKARIFGAGTLRVINRDDPAVWAMRPAAATSQPGRREAVATPAWVSFGAGTPTRDGDYGLHTEAGLEWLVQAQAGDEAPRRVRRTDAPAPEVHVQRLMPAGALRIQGRHNALNALAALALARAAGCDLAPMLYGLRDYAGEPHRVQPVGVVAGVEYIDDSKGTNVGATLAALQGLGAQRRLVVILGGQGKGQDFAPLAPAVATCARAVLLIGHDAPVIRAALAETGVPLIDAHDLTQAVELAAQQAQAGDAVLLSPACASLDQFRDYAHRAAVFVQAVQALAQAEGNLGTGA